MALRKLSDSRAVFLEIAADVIFYSLRCSCEGRLAPSREGLGSEVEDGGGIIGSPVGYCLGSVDLGNIEEGGLVISDWSMVLNEFLVIHVATITHPLEASTALVRPRPSLA